MYSQEDSHWILRDIRDKVQDVVKEQVQLFGHMSGLYLQQVFQQAEEEDISLKIDLSKLDDKVRLA